MKSQRNNRMGGYLAQKNIPWLGAFMESLYNSFPLLSIINFFSIVVVLYASVRLSLLGYFPWLSLWVFVGIFLFITAVVMLLTYKFVLPSLWIFREKQMFKNESIVAEKLDELIALLQKDKKDTKKVKGKE